MIDEIVCVHFVYRVFTIGVRPLELGLAPLPAFESPMWSGDYHCRECRHRKLAGFQ